MDQRSNIIPSLPKCKCQHYNVSNLAMSPISIVYQFNIVSESECKCLTCNQKPTGSQFSLLHEPN